MARRGSEAHAPPIPLPERFGHGEVVSETVNLTGPSGRVADRARVWRDRASVPLDRYLARTEISPLQFKAGDRLRMLAYRAGLEARLTQRISPLPGGSGNDPCAHLPPTEAAARARAEFRAAVAAVGPVLTPVLMAVCLDDCSAADWAKKRGRPTGHGLPTLICGLDMLINYWGLR